jgi:hypothetical protein
MSVVHLLSVRAIYLIRVLATSSSHPKAGENSSSRPSLSLRLQRDLIQYLSCESRAITSWRAGGRLEASSASAAATPAAAEIAPLNDNATAAAATTWVSARP